MLKLPRHPSRPLRIASLAICLIALATGAYAQELPDTPPTDSQPPAAQPDDAAEEQPLQPVQQDEIDQQLDQAQEQQQNQLDEAQEQLDRQQDDLNQQLQQDEEQSNGRLPLTEDEAAEAIPQDEQNQDMRLGISVDESSRTDAGITIGDVLRGSTAATAGLRRGDIIVSFDGQEVTSIDQLDRIVRRGTAGDRAEIIVLRNGQRHPLQLTFQEFHPDRHGQFSRPGFVVPGTDRRGWLGITLSREDEQRNQGTQGAVVQTVFPDGPAARAGIRPGDRLVEVQGMTIMSVDHLLETLSQTSPGDRIELVVLSNGRSRGVATTLEDASVFNVAAQGGYNDHFTGRGPSGYPAQGNSHDELMEQHRRMAEQHQRVESMLHQIQEDLDAIREELRMQRGGNTAYPDSNSSQFDSRPRTTTPQRTTPLGQDALPSTDEPQRPTDSPPNPQ